MLDHGRHGVGLDRVVKRNPLWQGLAQRRDTPGHQATVVGVEGRTAGLLHQVGERAATHLQHAVGNLELVHGRMARALSIHGAAFS